MPVKTLPAFTSDERHRAHLLLAARVAHMGTRKFEEGDWAAVYCGAKGIPNLGWSNLHIDISHGGLGVEQKMMSRKASRPITDACGTVIMHPAATRALRIQSLDQDANAVMADVFRQYAELIDRRADRIRAAGYPDPDLRTGWLLWQESLRQFLYFEERMIAPDPRRYRAVWNERTSSGARLGSKNLWIYEKETGQKRFSVTTQAGIKLQPYFEVPPPDDANLYVFIVQGEDVGGGVVRLWLTPATARDLGDLVGSLDMEQITRAILSADLSSSVAEQAAADDSVVEVHIHSDAYQRLATAFPTASDEHRIRSFIVLAGGHEP